MEQEIQKIFPFSDNCICIGSGQSSQSGAGYVKAQINVLTNTFNNSSNSRGNNFQINFPENGEKI